VSIEKDHADAILTALRTSGSPALTVHDGRVPDGGAPPYILAYFSDDYPSDSPALALPGESRLYVVRVYLHCVGSNAAAARAMAARATTALLDVVLTVPGRTCWPIRRESGSPPRRDETTGRLVMDKIDIYRLSTLPT
jgi:hypothetical protein